MQKKEKESDKIILIGPNKEEELVDEDLIEETKLKEEYEHLQKMEEEDHLTHLTRCIKCGKKIEMYTYFCNSTCDDQFIKERERGKEIQEKEK